MSTVTFNLQLSAPLKGKRSSAPVGATLNRSGLLSASCILMRASGAPSLDIFEWEGEVGDRYSAEGAAVYIRFDKDEW